MPSFVNGSCSSKSVICAIMHSQYISEALEMQDEPEIVPLRCIQTEETAMKELSALYGAQASAAPQPVAVESVPPSGNKTSRARSRRSDSRKDDNRKGDRRRSSGKSKSEGREKQPSQAQRAQAAVKQSRDGPRRGPRKETSTTFLGQERGPKPANSSAVA